jgi:type IV pilus assembly protein PilO
MNLSLNKLPWYGQVGLFAALGLMLLGAFYYLHVMPTSEEMQTREQRLDSLRADITKATASASRLNQLKQQVAQQEAELGDLKSRLPEEKDVAELLRRIQTLATQSNLAIRGFKPANSIAKEFHAEWPIALQLDGTYHNLGMFFDRVSKFSRIINVSNINIKAKDKPELQSTITADCVATTFVLLDTTKTAPPAKAKAN